MDKNELPESLKKNILTSIKKEELHRAQIYLAGSFVTAAASLVAVIFSVTYMIQGFYQSSFYSYFSLFFSDSDVAVAYWRELALSLVESVPVLELTLSLVAMTALLWSIRVFAQNARPHFMPTFSSNF